MKIAVFPGTFDPITNGHIDIVKKALPLFDKIIIAIGDNATKKRMFSLDQRLQWLEDVFSKEGKVEVASYEGLTINFCKKINASFILRGLRSVKDFEYEEQIAQVNKELSPEIETVFVLASQEYGFISSTIVRDLIMHGGDYKRYLPKEIVI
jgi:pantetheine-phosphate adenylyltransferase